MGIAMRGNMPNSIPSHARGVWRKGLPIRSPPSAPRAQNAAAKRAAASPIRPPCHAAQGVASAKAAATAPANAADCAPMPRPRKLTIHCRIGRATLRLLQVLPLVTAYMVPPGRWAAIVISLAPRGGHADKMDEPGGHAEHGAQDQKQGERAQLLVNPQSQDTGEGHLQRNGRDAGNPFGGHYHGWPVVGWVHHGVRRGARRRQHGVVGANGLRRQSRYGQGVTLAGPPEGVNQTGSGRYGSRIRGAFGLDQDRFCGGHPHYLRFRATGEMASQVTIYKYFTPRGRLPAAS